jgi:hypothetical protein
MKDYMIRIVSNLEAPLQTKCSEAIAIKEEEAYEEEEVFKSVTGKVKTAYME